MAAIGSSWLQGESGDLLASAMPFMVRGELRVYGGLRAMATAWNDTSAKGSTDQLSIGLRFGKFY